ncbi:hypothetical protein [Amnibacterium setariae]|uniref:hypothetical protein n=1 Tax=Amnibacterium setariae TaxID=2306585 RepID=UPI0011C41477|nr:hypothetical protein [Amnibacterium setariae]
MPAAARSETVAALQARIAAMQARTLGARTLPTDPAVAPLLPGGALRSGVAYAAPGSLALAMLLLAGPSAAGAWVGVVGIPEFGAEAAAELGVALDRLVLVPSPGEHWLSVTAQLAEVLPVVLVRPPARGASPSETARLASRLRQRDATLLVAGEWSGAEATLTATGGSWAGIGTGWGYLAARELDVVTTVREVRTRHRVRIETGFRPFVPAAPAAPVRPRPVAVPAMEAAE